jgi:UDP-N-acetylglucosamine--N-acetylmuramyl-(pentapeptide) pyrophosphoryl-undecaprenol N-acetylglucosamine transferase
VEPFLYEMDREMHAADLIVSRAGATTLAEIAAAGRPSILVPLPTATDDHQRRNGDALARAGAAELIDQSDLTGARLAASLLTLLADESRRQQMAAAARGLARPDAAQVIVERALELVEEAGRN